MRRISTQDIINNMKTKSSNILKLRYIKSGWIDKDEVLIHAMFEVLCNFLEDEPVEKISWKADSKHKNAWNEMQTLYKWWVKRQNREEDNPILQPNIIAPGMKFTPSDKKIYNPITKKEENTSIMDFVYKSDKDKKKCNKACDDCTKWEKKCYDEDNKMMNRLIKIRGYIWT